MNDQQLPSVGSNLSLASSSSSVCYHEPAIADQLGFACPGSPQGRFDPFASLSTPGDFTSKPMMGFDPPMQLTPNQFGASCDFGTAFGMVQRPVVGHPPALGLAMLQQQRFMPFYGQAASAQAGGPQSQVSQMASQSLLPVPASVTNDTLLQPFCIGQC